MQSLPLTFYSDQPAHLPFKANIFARIQEMKSVIASLTEVAQLPTAQKKDWLAENEVYLQRYIEEFSRHASFEFTMSNMDGELSQLLIEYTSHLQELMRVMQGVMSIKQLSLNVKSTGRKSLHQQKEK